MDQTAASSIMVVGDDAHFCYLMRRYIWKSEHQVVFVDSVDDVLTIAQQTKPVAIVLGIDQPGTRGWELLKSLKDNPSTVKIPVVLCSWSDDEARGQKEGAAVYLRMPILYDDFLLALKNIGIGPNG